MGAPLKYRSFRLLIRFILKLYYQGIESYGSHFIPKRGRTLFIGNHQAGLIDGILILGDLDQVIRSLIKHTLWKEPIVRFFAEGLGMIPVYRKIDLTQEEMSGSTSKERNQKSFDAVTNAFLRGESCLIFPEGISHDKPQLQQLKSGAARMILETEAANDFRIGIQWLPVAIDLETKVRPGFRALLNYHPPRSIEKYREIYQKDPEGAVHALRDEMQAYLSEITLNFDTWENRAFLERLTEIWLSQAPNNNFLDRHNQLLKWKRVLETTYSDPDAKSEWELLRHKVEELSESLDSVGISAEEVLERRTEGRKRLMARTVISAAIWAPFLLWGIIFWYVPLFLIKVATKLGAKEHRDVISTYHIIGSMVFFPLWFLIFTILCDYYLGNGVAFGLALISVAAGIGLLTSARRIRVQFRHVINMFRYRGIEEFLDEKEAAISWICSHAAKIWNNALKQQVPFESN